MKHVGHLARRFGEQVWRFELLVDDDGEFYFREPIPCPEIWRIRHITEALLDNSASLSESIILPEFEAAVAAAFVMREL